MSNSPANHNDDDYDDEQQLSNSSNSTTKLSSFNSRITSRSIIKRQQFTETRIANNQACDEIHDLQPKYTSNKKSNSHELMQGNYYDRTRLNYDSSLHEPIAISVEDYRDCIKKSTPISSNEISEQTNSPPFGETSESIQDNIAQSAGKLLETKKHSTKTTTKSHNQAVLDYFPHNNNNDDEHQQRSSSSSSSSNSSECSTDDSSQNTNDQIKSTVPYEPLVNDDDDDQYLEQPKKLPTDSSTKPHSQLTTNTNDRVKYVSTNGYNSHGSSITTKSSSDNSGSIRTNSGSDNEEESDEEHYNNSSATNNNNHSTENSYLYTNQNLNYQTSKYSEITQKKGEPLGQISRFKQLPTDDSNKQLSNDQTNLSSSSQSNRNRPEKSTNSRPIRSSKKRKQSQQQELIRTECIPGHRGNLDVDELVMFIDGNSSNNSVPLRPTDTNKPRLTNKTSSSSSTIIDSNSNKISSKKKSRKTSKSTSSSSIVFDDHEHDLINTNEEKKTNISTESQEKQVEKQESMPVIQKQEIPHQQTDSLSFIINNSNSEIVSEPFVTVTHRRRVVKERRPEPNPISRSTRFPPPTPTTTTTTNDKRRPPTKLPIESTRSTIKEQTPNTNSISSEPVPPPAAPAVPTPPPPPSSSSSSSNDPPTEKQGNSPRLSSHSSSSSLSSSLKRQNKPAPPVVFLNKSIDIDLNDVSFGFDLDTNPIDEQQTNSSIAEQETEMASSLNDSKSSEEKSIRKYPQRTNRTPQFYSGTDIIRPQQQQQQQRTYPSTTQASYIDPYLLYQYNQQRLSNYSQQFPYMNLLRTPYITPQSQYILLPTTYPPTTTTAATTTNESEIDGETHQTSNEQTQEPILVYTPQTGPVYLQTTTKKPYPTPELSQQTLYTSTYPTQFYYHHPSQLSHVMPSHSAYFQPITSPSLVMENKSEQDDLEPDDEYEHSNKSYTQIHQPTSADIMSNALQLVYSQQRKNAQTDRFNLDDLTAYLAMKWTDTVDHYLQGDSRILYVDEQ